MSWRTWSEGMLLRPQHFQHSERPAGRLAGAVAGRAAPDSLSRGRQLEQSGRMTMHIAGDFPGLEIAFWAIRT